MGWEKPSSQRLSEDGIGEAPFSSISDVWKSAFWVILKFRQAGTSPGRLACDNCLDTEAIISKKDCSRRKIWKLRDDFNEDWEKTLYAACIIAFSAYPEYLQAEICTLAVSEEPRASAAGDFF
jgi:hypothetical protein